VKRIAACVVAVVLLSACQATGHTSTSTSAVPRRDSIAITPRTAPSTTVPPTSTAARDAHRVHTSLQLDAKSVQSGESLGATVTFVNQTGAAVRLRGCDGFFKVGLGTANGPFPQAFEACLRIFTIPVGTSTQRAELWARPSTGTVGTVPAYVPGGYFAFVVFADDHPLVVAPSGVPVQVVGPVPTATIP
jgi:hypothetical protein